MFLVGRHNLATGRERPKAEISFVAAKLLLNAANISVSHQEGLSIQG
jgi:hypothetical protein